MARLENLTDRGLETQHQLRGVLMGLILEKGYERVSIKDITEKAGIDRSTFYLHFRDKEDLLEKGQKAIIDELMELRVRSPGPFPGITITFEHMANNADEYLAIFACEGISALGSRLQDHIAQGMMPILEPMLRENGIGPVQGTAPIAHYLAGALRGLARWWLEAGMPESPARMSELFLKLAVGGLQSLKRA